MEKPKAMRVLSLSRPEKCRNERGTAMRDSIAAVRRLTSGCVERDGATRRLHDGAPRATSARRRARSSRRGLRCTGHGRSSFEVCIRNDNRALYAVRLFVDGEEAEPGYFKKLRGDGDSTTFKGFICRREVHEFLFARSPVDERRDADASGSRPAHIGEVKALIYATRRVRIVHSESDSDDDEYHRGHRNLEMLGVRALPEKIAVKELGVQSRAGGAIERVSSSRRRRGDYRLEKIKPEVCELRLLYRDSFWLARHSEACSDEAGGVRGGGAKRPALEGGSSSGGGGGSSSSRDSGNSSSCNSVHNGDTKVKLESSHATAAEESSRRPAEGGSSSSVGARPSCQASAR